MRTGRLNIGITQSFILHETIETAHVHSMHAFISFISSPKTSLETQHKKTPFRYARSMSQTSQS